jgi:hypothetical protein
MEPAQQHHTSPLNPLQEGHEQERMANFEVNPVSFVPEGMNVKDWARPTHGIIIIAINPPCRHDE